MKLKETENVDKYRDTAKELKKFFILNLTMIPIIIGRRGGTPGPLSNRRDGL